MMVADDVAKARVSLNGLAFVRELEHSAALIDLTLTTAAAELTLRPEQVS